MGTSPRCWKLAQKTRHSLPLDRPPRPAPVTAGGSRTPHLKSSLSSLLFSMLGPSGTKGWGWFRDSQPLLALTFLKLTPCWHLSNLRS